MQSGDGGCTSALETVISFKFWLCAERLSTSQQLPGNQAREAPFS